MLLKALELQGYKTFASRTEFVFEPGITAIVGPNGSGKSNIADALRWVLGEQSYRLLRGKKTDDMIFGGSQKRARAGMAQVTIVLDNSDGHLPIEFSEVAISRRAYRSGENEYLLNGSRVRLRDINDLLGASGLGRRTYNVIGQGMVDAALSLRADERRALFEEAAGIALYKERQQDALGKLAATERNLERVHDIVGEIRPRLRKLERQAERSREFEQIRADLDNLLYLWYGYCWDVAKRQLRKARRESHERATALAAMEAEQADLGTRLQTLRQKASQLRARLGDQQHSSSQLQQQAEDIKRNLAVHTERLRLLDRQREELEAELGSLSVQRHRAAEGLAEAEQALASSESRWQEQEAAVGEARAALNARQIQISRLHDQEHKARIAQIRLESSLEALKNRRAELAIERPELLAKQAAIQETVAQEVATLADAEDELDSQQGVLAKIETELEDLEQQRITLTASRKQALAELEPLNADFRRAQTRLAESEAQSQMLADLRASGSGHDVAARGIMSAPDRPGGIIAPVAQLLRVPAELEEAIAAVLGAQLSALAVTDWNAAQQAIAHEAGRGGRLNLVPLKELRTPQPITSPDDPDAVGVGAELVGCDPAYQPVVDLLLGRALLVRSREAARRLVSMLPEGSCAVTLDGLVFAHDGRIVRSSRETGGLLAQERVRRVLPEQVKAARGALEAVDATLTSRRDDLDELTADLERLDARASRLRKQQQAARREWEGATLRVDRLTQSINWHRTQKQGLDREAEEQALELASSEQQQRQSSEQQATTGYALEQIQAQLAALPADGMLSRLSEQERELAQMEGFRQNQQVLVEVHRQSLGQLESQQTARERRIREIDQDREELAQQMNDERRLDLALSEQIADHSEQTAPVEKRLAEVETESQDILTVDDQHRRQVRSAERAQDLAQLTLDQRNAELERLRASISDELGLVHLPLDGDIRGQSPLPLGEVVGQLPTVKKLPTGLESSIQRRRQQLKRMGAINPNAPAEFVELENRYAFLTEQTDDLHEADAKLRQVIAELDTVMAAEFKRTFDAVAAEFRKAFTRLFGGGTARLVLADPDTPMQSGVEIVARPPDRRYQGLALLSGGERSLTAAALIFALLSVSPVPFCVLDEVDAMLDDMNVGRFREMLTELSAQTQFIVITHNRGTVQAADTIYGVSMSADGTSQIISLRLDGESLAAPDGEMRPEY